MCGHLLRGSMYLSHFRKPRNEDDELLYWTKVAVCLCNGKDVEAKKCKPDGSNMIVFPRFRIGTHVHCLSRHIITTFLQD